MDLAAIRARVRKLTGVRMEELLSTADLDAIINESYLHICSLGDWSFLYADADIATVGGQATYALPAGVAVPLSVAVAAPAANRGLLRRRAIEDFDRYPTWEADAAGGVPWGWAIRDHQNIAVYPTPGATIVTLRLRGWKKVAPLAAITDTPVFDAEFHPVLTLDTAARVLNEEGDDSGRSEQYRREATTFLLRMGQRYSLPEPDAAAHTYVQGETTTAESDDDEVR